MVLPSPCYPGTGWGPVFHSHGGQKKGEVWLSTSWYLGMRILLSWALSPRCLKQDRWHFHLDIICKVITSVNRQDWFWIKRGKENNFLSLQIEIRKTQERQQSSGKSLEASVLCIQHSSDLQVLELVWLGIKEILARRWHKRHILCWNSNTLLGLNKTTLNWYLRRFFRTSLFLH